MNIGKSIGIFGLCAAMLVSGCQMGGPNASDIARAEHDQPKAELVVEDTVSNHLYTVDETTLYNEVHDAGYDAIQKATDDAGISTMAPTEIAEHLNHPSVDGTVDTTTGEHDFVARFSNDQGASFEVHCTNSGMGDGLLDGTGPITVLQNGFHLQKTGENTISSDWVQVGKTDCHCLVSSTNLTMGQTAHMTSGLRTFTPVQVDGAFIAQ